MKMFGVLIASVGFIGGGLCDDRLIPFDGFFISVETNDWMNRPKDRQGLNVNVSLARYEDDPGGNVSTSVNCFEFPAGQRMFHQNEIQAFSEAANAGKLGKNFFKETQTQTIGGMEKTTFTTVKEQGEWVIQVSRAGKLALFEVEEGARLRKALDEAKAGEKWFRQLLVARKLPDMKPQMRPPLSNGYHVSSTLGKIQGRGMVYEVSVTTQSFRDAPRYSIEHGIEFRTAGGGFGSSGGLWVKVLLGKVSEALENIEKGEAYSFKSDEEGSKYTVVANLETNEADVTFYPGAFFGDRKAKRGHFSSKQLKEIRKLVDSSEVRKNWFREHEEWFFRRVEEKGK